MTDERMGEITKAGVTTDFFNQVVAFRSLKDEPGIIRDAMRKAARQKYATVYGETAITSENSGVVQALDTHIDALNSLAQADISDDEFMAGLQSHHDAIADLIFGADASSWKW